MPVRNTPTSYGAITKTFHWLTALLVFTVIPLGLAANSMAADLRNPAIPLTEAAAVRTALLFSLHKTTGVAIFFVALARILWAISQPRPGLLNAHRRGEATLAETVHWLLYGSLVLVPLAGWISHAAATGFAPIWWPFGQSLPFVPRDESVAATFGTLHIIFQRVFFLAILLHIAGALKHHFGDRDLTLRRMLPRGPGTPAAPPQPPGAARSAVALIAALAIWAAALGLGTAIGAFDRSDAETEATGQTVPRPAPARCASAKPPPRSPCPSIRS